MYPIIDVESLSHLPERQLLDCRFDLMKPELGYNQYLEGHIPGAQYADLDRDLATLSAGSGRHPLPSDDDFSRTLSRWGIAPGKPVVVYDGASGAFAARAWWMLKVCGFECAVLDGGLSAWSDAGMPLQAGMEEVPPTLDEYRFDRTGVVSGSELAAELESGKVLLIDARAPERYRGEVEPIDAVGGHVPGAVNRPFSENLSEGRFKTREQLAAEWTAALGDRPAQEVVHMCGSGVTACTNLLAMEAAGKTGSRLFVGSWSGWIAQDRPVATG